VLPTSAVLPVAPVEELAERYRDYLLGERGLAPSTVRYYARIATVFLGEACVGDGELDLAGVSAGAVGRFLLERSSARSTGTVKNTVVALRSLLVFLHVEGLTGDLTGLVPSVAPRGRGLPRAVGRGTVARLLASCDRRSATGRRDYAVLMLLARLGLRASEVAAIELPDVDWREGSLLVRDKGARRELMPLPVDVGEALAGYVKRGRPRAAESRRLFWRVIAPAGPLTSDAVSGVVRAACRRCEVPEVGAHALRHTAATETLRAGGSLTEIGQLLRQQTAFATAIYARVDHAALAMLARPWPETAR
jgi:integrase/recombinase XerD